MRMSMLLEEWAEKRLQELGVDGVFAPYVVSMVTSEEANATDEEEEELRFNIHQVLMGWLSPEDEDKAYAFVADLLAFAKNPMLLPPSQSTPLTESAESSQKMISGDHQEESEAEADELLKESASTAVSAVAAALQDDPDDISEMVAGADMELKASAPLFVPGSMNYSLSNGDGAAETSRPEPELVLEPEADFDAQQTANATTDSEFADEDSFFWSVAYELVEHLQLKFSDVDPTRMCELLRLVQLDVDKAHAVLKATIEKESIGSMQVCRHYLQGECRRADCMFVHDTHCITCRFWLRGACFQEDNCVFAHDFCELYALEQAGAFGKRDYDSEDEGDNFELNGFADEMFPSLRHNSSASEAASAAPSSRSDASLGLDFARAVSLQPAPTTVSSASFNGRDKAPSWNSGRTLYHRTADELVGNKWVETGGAVGSQYLELRERAYEMACVRNKCFMRATEAYRSGNSALAKSLSVQGHEYNAKMKNYHFLAASQIFEMRNPTSQLYNDRLMDLHGLHVAEAVEFLSQKLPLLAEDGFESIYIVTGSGHHSKGPQANARLLPAVQRFLATEGYSFNPVADRRGYVGMLLVDLRW